MSKEVKIVASELTPGQQIRVGLTVACLQYGVVSNQVRFTPGNKMIPEINQKFPFADRLAGKYGLQLTPYSFVDDQSHDALIAAQVGFDLRDTARGIDIVINNSPQGLPETLFGDRLEEEKRALLRTLKGNFRDILMKSLTDISNRLKSMGVRRIVATSAYNHPKIGGMYGLTEEQALKSMDELCRRHGFQELSAEESAAEEYSSVDFALNL